MYQFSEQEKQDIAQNYLINYNIQELAKQYNVSAARIKTVLRNKEVKIIVDRQELWKKRYPRNSDVFEKIDTPQKAYWLGFLYADGSVGKTKKTVRITLSTKDIEHLYKFKNFLNATNTEIKQNNKVENDKNYELSYFAISDEKLCNDLIKAGCIPNKTYSLSFPSENILPKELQYHFIRGFFDGDGSITIDRKRNRINISFTGTKEMLNEIKKIFGKDKLKLEDKGNFAVLHIDGNKQVLNILNQVYKDSFSEIELPRKREKYEEFLKTR